MVAAVGERSTAIFDSTIWPAEVEYLKAEKELHGTQNFLDKWFEHHELVERYGEDYSDIFKLALAPDRVREREMYPYAAECLRKMYLDGFGLHFISHNMFASDIREPIREWIRVKVGAGVVFGLTVMHQRFRKENIMKQDPTAWLLIDDVPKNLSRARAAGYHVLCKAHHWNEGVSAIRFTDWFEVPGLIRELTKLESCGKVISV